MQSVDEKMRSKKINVLIISQYFPPDVSGGSTRAYNYAKCLADQNDYQVTVITAPPHQHSAVPKEYRGRLVVKEKMFGMNLFRVWVPSILHSSVRNSTVLMASFLFSSLFPLFSVKPDVIIAFEPNLFSIIPSYFYSKLRGGLVINVVDDLWPEALYERDLIKSKVIKSLLYKLARFSYTYSKFIIPLNEEVKEIIYNSYKIENNKIEAISHGIDTKFFTYQERKRQEYFIVMYSGSLVESYDFDIIINSARRLKGKKIKFVIRGKGRLLQYIQEQKNKYQIDNLEINTDFVPTEKVSDEISKSDVLLAPMGQGFSLNLSMPTKILEYQAVGRPIICSSDGAVGNYVKETRSGIKVDIGDTDAFIEAICRLESDPELCKTLGRNGRKFVEENLTFENIGIRLTKVIRLVLSTNT